MRATTRGVDDETSGVTPLHPIDDDSWRLRAQSPIVILRGARIALEAIGRQDLASEVRTSEMRAIYEQACAPHAKSRHVARVIALQLPVTTQTAEEFRAYARKVVLQLCADQGRSDSVLLWSTGEVVVRALCHAWAEAGGAT